MVLVGKGIVYDTGGLSIKPKDGMPGIEADCGGAAALLGAFEAAVEIGLGRKALHLVLCLAENAVGPGALRPTTSSCLSGLTCEINNSDAEGRLVLADGVAHATSAGAAARARGAARPCRRYGDAHRRSAVATAAAPCRIVSNPNSDPALTLALNPNPGKRHAGIVSNLESVEREAVLAGLRSGDTCHRCRSRRRSSRTSSRARWQT